MPTYAYACTECDHRFEVVQSFSDDSLTVCPVCGGKLRKVFNAVGVVFKGSGFYRNDSRSTPKGSEAGGSGGDSGKADSGDTSGTTTEKGAAASKTAGKDGASASPSEKGSSTSTPAKPSPAKSSSKDSGSAA